MKLVLAISMCSALCLAAAHGLAKPSHTAKPNPTVVNKTKLKTGIQWEVQPEHTVIKLDGKRLGTAGKVSFTKTRAGKHTVHLIKGGDETEMDVHVKKGNILKIAFSFDE